MKDISIVIVNYNTPSLTQNCINSLIEQSFGINFEIIVVDNGSSDDSCSYLKNLFEEKIILIKSPVNLGFGKGNNLGIQHACGKYIFLLNSDTVVLNNVLKIFFDFMEKNNDVAVCGGNLFDKNRNPAHSFKKNLPGVFLDLNFIFDNLYTKFTKKRIDFNYNKIPLEVNCITGADMFIRKSVLDIVGGFDSDFFMYFEETELSFRIKKAGFKIFSVPTAEIIHLEGHSFKIKESKLKMEMESRFKYFEKTHGKNSVFFNFFISKIIYSLKYFVSKNPYYTLIKKIIKEEYINFITNSSKLNFVSIFNNMEKVHLGKDVFLTPYYLSKEFNLNLKFVTLQSNTNDDLPYNYREKSIEKLKKYGHDNSHFLIREFSFFKYLFLNGRNIDILMLIHFSDKNFLLSLIYKLVNPKGKIYIKFDINKYSLSNLQITSNSLFGKIKNFITKIFIKLISSFSVETNELYELILKNGIRNVSIVDKLFILHNCFDDESLNNIPVIEKNFFQKENIMVTVSRLGDSIKNSEMLLEALNNLDIKNWKFYFIGPYSEDFRNKYDNFIIKNPDKKDLVFLTGNISDKKNLYDYYNKSKVYIITSISECLPFASLEALRFGNYILTTEIDGASELTNNKQFGKIIDINDVDSLKREIINIIENNTNISYLSHCITEYSKEKFSFKYSIKSLKEKRGGCFEKN